MHSGRIETIRIILINIHKTRRTMIYDLYVRDRYNYITYSYIGVHVGTYPLGDLSSLFRADVFHPYLV